MLVRRKKEEGYRRRSCRASSLGRNEKREKTTREKRENPFTSIAHSRRDWNSLGVRLNGLDTAGVSRGITVRPWVLRSWYIYTLRRYYISTMRDRRKASWVKRVVPLYGVVGDNVPCTEHISCGNPPSSPSHHRIKQQRETNYIFFHPQCLLFPRLYSFAPTIF